VQRVSKQEEKEREAKVEKEREANVEENVEEKEDQKDTRNMGTKNEEEEKISKIKSKTGP